MVQLLINDVHYPTIQQDTISVDRTANDPISTFNFTLQDDPSQIALSELQEIIFLDESQIASPTHNLLQNPLISPYATAYSAVINTGGSLANLSPGVQMTLNNATAPTYLTQNTQNGLVIPGQNYMLSTTVQTTTFTNCQVILEMLFYTANLSVLGIQSLFVPTTTSATRVSVAAQAPPGTAIIEVLIGIQPLVNGSNSGTVSFTNIQLEPMSFTTGTYQLSYPTPFCATGQANCTALPDNTTIRQYRLFGGYITKATAGHYIGNNRQWTVQVSSYAWLLQKQLLNSSWTGRTDAYIINQIVATYFPNMFSTAQVATGATLDVFGYTFNGTARDAFNALAANAGFFFYVDAYRTIIYQPPGYNTLGFMLSDHSDNVASFPYYEYALDIDGTQLANATLVTGASNISAVEYDAQSIGYYNVLTNGQGIFWRTVNDSTITTTNAARQRAIAENATYNYARKIVHLSTQQLMIPGYTVLFSSTTDNLLNAKYVIQKATLSLIGFQSLLTPTYECVCELGAFNPDGVNITVKMLRKQQVSVNSIGTPVIGLMTTEQFTFIDTVQVTRVTYNPGVYGTGIYGTTTYAASFPAVPTTIYGTGKYGDGSKGYN